MFTLKKLRTLSIEELLEKLEEANDIVYTSRNFTRTYDGKLIYHASQKIVQKIRRVIAEKRGERK